MQYLPWILAIIVLGMLAYPILQIIPSKQQKLRIQMRQAAIEKGLKVQVRNPSLPSTLQDTHRELLNCVAYHLPVFNDGLKTHLAIRSLNNKTDWYWPDKNRPPTKYIEQLLALYQQLPDYVLAVEHSPVGHSIFWQEQGDIANVTVIEQILKNFAELLKK